MCISRMTIDNDIQYSMLYVCFICICYVQSGGYSDQFMPRHYPISHMNTSMKHEHFKLIRHHQPLNNHDASDSDDEGYRNFYVGQYIDANDSVGKWLIAQVISIDHGKVHIHYDGWPSKWDETIDINSLRLARFGRFTANKITEQHLIANKHAYEQHRLALLHQQQQQQGTTNDDDQVMSDKLKSLSASDSHHSTDMQ